MKHLKDVVIRNLKIIHKRPTHEKSEWNMSTRIKEENEEEESTEIFTDVTSPDVALSDTWCLLW